MAKDKQYTADDIQVLSDREHVRLRTAIYLGNIHQSGYTIPLLTEPKLTTKYVEFVPAVYKAIGEVVDNAIDEFAQITSKNKVLKLTADPQKGLYVVSDNGRGIPIDTKMEIIGKTQKEVYIPELALSRLRAGRNFTDEKEIGVIGQNGVGSACTNFCSSSFEVIVTRDGQKYYQKFTDGAKVISKPKIVESPSKVTGTAIKFQLDPTVFKNVALPNELMRNRAIEIAMTNPDITVEYNHETFKYKNGFKDFINQIAKDKTHYCIDINEDNIQGQLFVIFDAHNGQDEQMFTWVNSSLLFDGGKCNTQFFNVLFDKTITHLEKEAKKLKTEVTRNDIRQGLLVLANLKIKNPEYDSQAKTRLTGPDLRKDFVGVVDSNWKSLSKTANKWLLDVLERANERHHKQANKKAVDEHEKKKRKPVEGLLDATSSNRLLCQVLITEGLSAKSQISEARDPTTTAAFALTGKINNVYGSTVAQVLNMGKLTELLAVIGLTPGKRAIRSQLNYGHRIVIATDADVDGSDIFTLLINLFFQFWPELFSISETPIVYRLMAPNVVASKGKKRIHFTTREDYEKVKDKYNGWTIEYMKGLGSMSKQDWEMILSGQTDTYIPIIDDGSMRNTLDLLFGPNADDRKEWLTL